MGLLRLIATSHGIRRTLTVLPVMVLLTGCSPRPGTKQIRLMNAALDMTAFQNRAPTPSAPVTLEDALAFADRYNIEGWIAAQESQIQRELASQATLKMLPSLMAGANYHERSEYDASSSQSFKTGEESLEPSFSSEKRGLAFDIAATWNLLDFGISYLRSWQQTSRVGIAQERERRVRQNLALQVTRVYWQAVTAKEAAELAEAIDAETSSTLSRVRKEIDEKVISKADGLRRETALLQQQDELRRYQRHFQKAKTELGRMMGLTPGTQFTLAEIDFDLPLEPVSHDVGILERVALLNRPELFEKDFEEAISRDEARIALAQMFPSPAAFLRHDYDSNRFLVFNDWNSLGLRVSWDLLALPHLSRQRKVAELQTDLTVARRTAIAVAVLTQLHLSLIDYQEALAQHVISEAISDKHRQLLEAIQSEAEEGKSHEGESVDQRIKYLRARARYLTARAEVMTSQARLVNTVGLDPPWRDKMEIKREDIPADWIFADPVDDPVNADQS